LQLLSVAHADLQVIITSSSTLGEFADGAPRQQILAVAVTRDW